MWSIFYKSRTCLLEVCALEITSTQNSALISIRKCFLLFYWIHVYGSDYKIYFSQTIYFLSSHQMGSAFSSWKCHLVLIINHNKYIKRAWIHSFTLKKEFKERTMGIIKYCKMLCHFIVKSLWVKSVMSSSLNLTCNKLLLIFSFSSLRGTF